MNIYAHTPSGDMYPEFISINDGPLGFEVVVRNRPIYNDDNEALCGEVAAITLTDEQAILMAEAILKFYKEPHG